MMRRVSHGLAAIVTLILVSGFAGAEDLVTLSDLQLIEKTREAVVAQDAEAALGLLTEMQRGGTGIFAGAEKAACEEAVDLPDGITDWRFRGAARQAYITAAKKKAMEEGSCGCLFKGFAFETFSGEILGKVAADLVDGDRERLEAFLTEHQRETEARYRDLEKSCRAE